MRAWIFQLNADKGLLRDGRRDVPITAENVFRICLSGTDPYPLVEGWSVSQFYREARKGDPLLLRSGGREKLGVFACGRIEHAERNDLSFRADRSASNKLRANPIPIDWMQRVVPRSQRNLVRLEPYWARISVELAKRGVNFGEAEPRTSEPIDFDTSEPMTEEGKRYVAVHLRTERKNRRRVLANSPRPYRCEACGFSFAGAFGPEYAEYIQVHHRVPVSSGVRTPRAEDFALLCANCHVIAHWKQPTSPLALDQLRALLASGRASGGPQDQAVARAPPIDPTPGALGLFVFRVEDGAERAGDAEALRSVLDALADVEPDQVGPVLVVAGGVHEKHPSLGHLLLSPPAFLVGVEVPQPVLRQVFAAWRRVAPSTALSAGAVNTTAEELGLPGRIQLRGDRVFVAKEDEPVVEAWANAHGRVVASGTAERFAMSVAMGLSLEELKEVLGP